MKNNPLKEKINNILYEVFNEQIELIEKDGMNWNIEGLIDSFASLEVIMHIEEKFNIAINLEHISFEELSCTNNILKLIKNYKK